MREQVRARFYSRRTEETYVYWIRQYILHHGKRHPRQLGEKDVRAFLSHLAVQRRVARTPSGLR